jgi:DNA processing protein
VFLRWWTTVLSKQEKLARLRLIRSPSVWLSTFWHLMQLYGSAEKAIRALPKLSQSSGKTLELGNEEKIFAEIEALRRIGARLVFWEDELYPPLLRNISDPPPVLAFLGNKEKSLQFYRRDMVSVVGSRNASVHACKFCSSLCKELSSNGLVIVSGLARGIDSCAHLGSLENGTVAIFAGGINVVYPSENAKLYDEIIKNGAVFAEMPYDTPPQPKLFPRRNRIIAGMSCATIVVEAAEQSGSLITAKMATEYGREVFAVPGFPLDPRSVGCNRLLRDGATMLQKADDVLEFIENRRVLPKVLLDDSHISFTPKISERDLEKTRQKVLKALSTVPITIDEMIAHIDISPQEVLTALLELELANKIIRLHGQRVCLSAVDN